MKFPLISIIIPVYNVEKYLEKCVRTIINQTYQNIEIILVDDGSTDGSGKICDNLQKVDTRIKVIHKENGGLSDARNVALDIMNGKYVTFVDSDDYVTDDYVEYLYNLLQSTNSDMAICCLKKIYNEREELINPKEKIEILSSEDAIENYLYQKKFTASACCKMYKRELFSKLRYPVGYYYEDMAIICKLLDMSKIISISNQKKYYYIQRKDSIMGECFNPRKMYRIEIAEEIRNFISEKYPNMCNASYARCFLAAVQTIREIPFTKQNAKFYDLAWKEILLYRTKVLVDKKTKTTHKIIALFSFFGKKTIKLMGNMYTKLFCKKQ